MKEKITPYISIVVCTHNRAVLLRRSLRILLKQDFPREKYEVRVVDNRSTDDTRVLVEDVARQNKNVQYVYEEKLGLSCARNRGLAEAKGEYIAYLDDDAFVQDGWLDAITDTFDRYPKVVCVGGVVDPLWEIDPPQWMTKDLAGYFSVVDWGKTERPIANNEWLVGTNMAYRKKALIDIGGFDTQLGRKGRKLLSMEEVMTREALEGKGGVFLYQPAMKVCHVIPRERISQGWLLRRLYWQAVSDGIILKKKKTWIEALAYKRHAIKKLWQHRKGLSFFIGNKKPALFRHALSFVSHLGLLRS